MPGSVSKETPGNTFRPEASPGGFLKTRHTAQAIKIRLAHGTVLTSLNYSSRDTFGGGGGGEQAAHLVEHPRAACGPRGRARVRNE